MSSIHKAMDTASNTVDAVKSTAGEVASTIYNYDFNVGVFIVVGIGILAVICVLANE